MLRMLFCVELSLSLYHKYRLCFCCCFFCALNKQNSPTKCHWGLWMTVEIADKPFSLCLAAWSEKLSTHQPFLWLLVSLLSGLASCFECSGWLWRHSSCKNITNEVVTPAPRGPAPGTLLRTALTVDGSIPGKQASVTLDDPAPSLIQDGKGECCMTQQEVNMVELEAKL